jgi:hypothetical protein
MKKLKEGLLYFNDSNTSKCYECLERKVFLRPFCSTSLWENGCVGIKFVLNMHSFSTLMQDFGPFNIEFAIKH